MSDNNRDELADELERKQRDLAELRVRLASRVGELRGRVHERFESLRTDPDTLEDLRALAWLRHRPKGAPRPAVEYDHTTGRVVPKRPGWPPGVDPTSFTRAYLDTQRDSYLEQFDAHVLTDPPEPEDTPSVRRLRDALGAGGGR